jgi:serine protease inhibitor
MSNSEGNAGAPEAGPALLPAFDGLAGAGDGHSRNAGNLIMGAQMKVTRLWRSVRRRALIGGMVTVLGGSLRAASPADQANLVSADTGFAFGLLNELAKEQPGKNVFISPYSISTVLQMVCNGAQGSTRNQMTQVLGTSGLDAAAVSQAYKDLAASVRNAQTNVALNIANAIWYSAGIEVKPAFAALNKDCYGATMDALDFSAPGAPAIVNGWAEKNTSGRIKNIVGSRLPADTRMLLANAIYFKGHWDRKFDPRATKERPFHLLAGSQKQVPMMQQSGEFEYQEENGCQAVRLPYAGRRLGMYVLLPEPGSNVNKLLATLNDHVWQDQLLRQLQRRKGSIVLPRFKLEYGAELKQPLEAMGMTLPFTQGADFSGMSASALFLSSVRHKSFVEVNEQGTEAAAATVGIVSLAVMRPLSPPFEMVVDRPFLFVIGDNLTRTILFLSVVFEPASTAG